MLDPPRTSATLEKSLPRLLQVRGGQIDDDNRQELRRKEGEEEGLGMSHFVRLVILCCDEGHRTELCPQLSARTIRKSAGMIIVRQKKRTSLPAANGRPEAAEIELRPVRSPARDAGQQRSGCTTSRAARWPPFLIARSASPSYMPAWLREAHRCLADPARPARAGREASPTKSTASASPSSPLASPPRSHL